MKNNQISPLIKIYSHPRSGTHFLEAFLAKNFYRHRSLTIHKFKWGHWSARKNKFEIKNYIKLFGDHKFPELVDMYGPSIYIYRDGRAVSLSCWKTPGFKNTNQEAIVFSDYLRTKIDWVGTPATKCKPKETIIQHWLRHVDEWNKFSKTNTSIYMLRYEDLLSQPAAVVDDLCSFFPFLIKPNKIDPISKPIGLLPNKGRADEWIKYFSVSDNEYFDSIVNKNHFARSNIQERSR